MANKFYLALFAFGLGISLSPNSRAVDVACNPGGSSREIVVCANDDYKKQDLKMNELYKEELAKEQQDADPADPRSVNYQSDLRDAQRAWIKFRDATCLYEVGPMSSYGSSSDWGIFQFNCLTRLTKQRIETLKAYIACGGGGTACP